MGDTHLKDAVPTAEINITLYEIIFRRDKFIVEHNEYRIIKFNEFSLFYEYCRSS